MENREFKFRGKSINHGEWVYGKLHGFGIDLFDEPVKEDTICQFTGLHDKNGKEIYEGDIVKAPLLDPIFGDVIKDAFCNAEIRFNKGAFVVSYYKGEHNIYIQDLCDKIEVVGNIYDNKDLLED